jgi:hypothetical protein
MMPAEHVFFSKQIYSFQQLTPPSIKQLKIASYIGKKSIMAYKNTQVL